MLKNLMIALLILSSYHSALQAQITVDGTLGQRGALSGPDYQIGAELGQQHGSNLFHSFQDFNLQSHESATFSGPPTVSNVISRVTGGNPSNLDGTIRSTIPNANLYLLNPSGILFGPHAKLDVQGGFHASTADYLRLNDGGRFDARTPSNSLLTVAPVAAFGFLTSTPAPITLQNSHLSVPDRQSLSLLGGDLSLSGQLKLDDTGKPQFKVFQNFLTPISIPIYTSQLTAPAGQINLASVAAAGEVNWIDSHLDPATPRLGGSILLDNTDLNVNGPGGGNLFLRAGLLKLTNSHLESQTLGDQNGGIIDVNVDNLLIRGGELYAGIHANSWGAGMGSTIRLQARQMEAAGGVLINASTYHLGNPGNVIMTVDDTLNFEGQYLPLLRLPSGIFNTVVSMQPDLDQENPATMEIQAGSLNLLKGAEIGTITFGTKDSANILVKVRDRFVMTGEIRESDNAFGEESFTFPSGIISNSYMGSTLLANFGIDYPRAGNGGNIQIEADQISMDDKSLISAQAVHGNAGNIDIRGRQLLVKNGSTIVTSSYGKGHAGKLQITMTDQLRLSGKEQQEGQDPLRYVTGLTAGAFTASRHIAGGNGGSIEVQAGQLIIEDLAQINVISETDGNAGNLQLKVDKLEIRSGIVTSSTVGGSGSGGEISIQAREIKLSEAGLINSAGLSPKGGKAGNIQIETDSLTLLSGGNISVSTIGTGDPGKIRVTVSGNLLLSGQATEKWPFLREVVGRFFPASTADPSDLIGPSKIDAAVLSSQGDRPAGSVEIKAGRLEIRDGAEISSAHLGGGDAGNLLIQAQEIHLKNGALTTETKGGGGGNIDIRLPGLLYLVEGKITTSVGTGKGSGGDITIDHPQFSLLNLSQIRAQADEGHGGNIQIRAEHFFASSDSLISASAKRGIDGKVIIAAPNENISSSLQGLTPQLISAMMLKRPCYFTSFEEFLNRSRFSVYRLAGIPQLPGDWHPSPYLSARQAREWQSQPATKTNPSSPPPRGKQDSGESVLVAMECQKGGEK